MNEFLDFISINLPTVIISVLNVFIMYLVFRRFLFARVQKVMAERKGEIEKTYEEADASREQSETLLQEYHGKLSEIQLEKDKMLKEAEEEARLRGEAIVAKSRDDADHIRKETEKEAVLARKNMYQNMKEDVTDVAMLIAEKVLEREVNADAHKDIVVNFINELELSHE